MEIGPIGDTGRSAVWLVVEECKAELGLALIPRHILEAVTVLEKTSRSVHVTSTHVQVNTSYYSIYHCSLYAIMFLHFKTDSSNIA